jgi:hypothetical protein
MTPDEAKLRQQLVRWRRQGRWFLLALSLFLIASPFFGPRPEVSETAWRQGGPALGSEIGNVALARLAPIVGITGLIFVMGRWNGTRRDRLLLELAEKLRNK